jgi:N-acetylglucosaminyl-diphospho-decaprenol L-rhamnosyltransferase
MKLCVIILNYRRAGLTIDCLKTLQPQIEGRTDRCVVCIDNASDDGSVDAIDQAIEHNNWNVWLRCVRSPTNRGFAGGNNVGFQNVQADYYLLLNSDARMTPGAIDNLLNSIDRRPEVGAIGPRLQGEDGKPQVSCFRYRTPITEMLEAAGTGPLDRLFYRRLVPMGVFEEPMEPQWLSFACIMIRREVVEQIGLMDEGYFMYFEDIDYSRRMKKAGWKILHEPAARVTHLRGGTSSVKAALKARTRVPKYYYESRSRYFARYYGGIFGLWMTNVMWVIGRSISLVREWIERRERGSCEREAFDNWTNFLRPFRAPTLQKGGEL